MTRALIGKELYCQARNETGLLGRIVVAMAQEGVFIQHLCAYTAGDMGHLQLVTREEDCGKAEKAIAYFIKSIKRRDVLIVEFENKVGTLASVAKILGNNEIGIDYVYGTSSDGFKIIGVFSTTDNYKAAELINQDSGHA